MTRSVITCLSAVFVAIGVVAPFVRVGAATTRDVHVTSSAELRTAVRDALPGDVIIVASGTYELGGRISVERPGSSDAPITLRAGTEGDAQLRFDGAGGYAEGLQVMAPHWIIEGFDIVGTCPDDSSCEHAFHIVGAADGTVVRGNVMREFNAAIKGNGDGSGPPANFPDDVLVESNEIFNARARNTGNPVTPIDVVGGRRWVVRGNFIHDFEKGGGNQISYAAFLKGNSKNGLFERNLIVCEHLHRGGIRLGLSFGGGGSQPERICEEGTCTPEHEGGIMRNNIVANCPADVGIYLNAAADTKIYHNTIFNTGGIDVRFGSSTADLRYNILDGRIRERDGGTKLETGNAAASTDDLRRWFADPDALDFGLTDGASIVGAATTVDEVIDDFCGVERVDGAPDSGAIEYTSERPCDTSPTREATPWPPVHRTHLPWLGRR